MSLLLIERGPNAGTRIPLIKFPITIGRDAANTIHIDDEQVSRFHLRIKKRGRLFVVEDLESKNGTFINGDRILNSLVRNGDKILIGSSEIVFLTSESDVHFVREVMHFDMIVSDDLGITGPIDLNQTANDRPIDAVPFRLSAVNVANELLKDTSTLVSLHEIQSNLLVVDTLEDAGQIILKFIGKIIPYASRAALFSWIKSNRQLIPISVRHYKKKKSNFTLSRKSMEDVLTRKQGVHLKSDKSTNSPEVPERIIIPINHHDEVICLIHIEISKSHKNLSLEDFELAQSLIGRCAPIFEALILKGEIDAWMIGMIETMIAAIEAKDTYTHGHSERVSKYSLAIADEMRLNHETKRLLLVSALCHDIGKIGIPDYILKKASMLSSEEYEEMKLHPTIGSEIIRHMPNAQRFLSGVKHHHEKWDGSGYPDGLAGEEIPFFGRIVAVADVFDAMVSGRAYSGFLDQSDAISKLNEEKELFDPEILKACTKAYEKGSLTQKTSTAGKGQVDADYVEKKPNSSINELKSQNVGVKLSNKGSSGK